MKWLKQQKSKGEKTPVSTSRIASSSNGRSGTYRTNRSSAKCRLYGIKDVESLESAIAVLAPFAVIFAISILSMFFSKSANAMTPQTGLASFYGVEACKFNPTEGCPMASGKSLYTAIKEGMPYAATWEHPIGTWLVVRNSDGKETLVVVADRGPAKRLNRVIDLNPDSFGEICNKKDGLCTVTVEAL